MPLQAGSSMDLGLGALPEIIDPKLFPEFVRIYNALKILAQAIDSYTGEGTVIDMVENTNSDTASSITEVSIIIKSISKLLDIAVNQTANQEAIVAELQKQYRRYKVPRFAVTGPFGCNGAVPQVSYVLGAAAGNAAVGGVGTAAGGWDTAANRDATIATINAHAVAINDLQIAVKNCGIGA